MKTICKKWKLRFVLITLFTLVLNSFTAFADINHLMINTDSNALMTLELDDSDYAIMPMSTLGTVTNTLTAGSLNNTICYRNINDLTTYVQERVASLTSNRYSFYNIGPNNYGLYQFYITLDSSALPPSGKYKFSFDFASDFVLEYDDCFLRGIKYVNNAYFKESRLSLKDIYSQYSGDIYISPVVIDFRNFDKVELIFNLDYTKGFRDIGGSYSVRFVPTSEEAWGTLGDVNSSSAYQDDVSSSLSDLSSSVDTMTDEISGVTEAIQNLQGAMEPHYSNVLTQLHHITEQLHAFYDQIYNNIHLKEYALWQDIKTAIENIDLEVNVNLDKLKTSIDNMSQAVQNKLQSVTDTITGGYNNSGMQEDNNELSGALDELDNAEQEVLDDVNGYIEGFEYPSFDGISSGIIGALSFFGGFLHSIFLGMGEFGLIITFSLTMIFVLIIVGYHRIRS